MSGTSTTVERRIQLSADHAERLRRLTEDQRISEDQVIARAIDILFSLSDIPDAGDERRDWSALSETSLARVWDNGEDASYDNWRELYGLPAR